MSFQHLKALLSARINEDGENARVAGLLHALTLWGIPMLLFIVGLRVVSGENLMDSEHVFIFILILFFVTGQFLIRRGYLRLTSSLIMFAAWGGITFTAWGALGLHDASLLGYLTVLFASSILLGNIETLTFFVLSLLVIWWFAYLEAIGVRAPALAQSPYSFARDLSIAFVSSGAIIYFIVHALRRFISQSEREIRERKEADETLLQFRQVMDETNEAIFMVDPETSRYIDFNRSACESLGYSRDELLQLGVINISKNAVNMQAWHERVDLIRNNELRVFETVYLRKDGTTFPVEVSARILDYGRRKPLVAVVRDITERKRAETVIRESEERFRKVFHSSPIAICITTLMDGRLLDANYAYWDLTGLDAERSIGKNLVELHIWSDQNERDEFVRKLTEKRSHYDPDSRFFDASGRTRYTLAFYELIQIGEDECILSMFYDMSGQKRTMEALRQSEMRTRALLEAMPDMLLELSADGIIRSMVPPKGMEQYMLPENFVGRHVREVLLESSASQTLFALGRVIETGHMSAFEFEMDMNDLRGVMEARLVSSGSDTVLMMIRDITQQKTIERERENLIDELEGKNAEAEILREGAAAVALSLDFDETVSRILDQLQRAVPYDSASVQLLVGDELEIIGGRGFPEGKDPTGMRFPFDEDDPAYPILRDGLPYIYYPDIQQASGRFKGFFHVHILSWLAVPLYARGRLTGMFVIDGFESHKFTEAHARFVVTFANQVAVTLENSRLYAELQLELKKQIALRNAITAITSSLRLNEVLGEICKQMASGIDATSAYIASYDPAHSSYTVVADYLSPHVNELEQVSDLNTTYFKKDGAWLFDETNDADFAIIHADDESLTPLARHNLLLYGAKSVLYIPLFVQDRLIGHAELWESRRKRVFTSEEIAFCRAISLQAAIAIENADLFEEVQKELALRKALISELESKNSELERFTYTVSHDLKSPLFTIRGFLGYLEQDAFSGNRERMKADMQRIIDATDRMQRLLNELLELSRIGRLKNEPEYVSFEELAREALELVQGRIMERGVSVHLDADLPTVHGDRQRLLEVLQNLLDNAAKFMGDQREPRIEIGQEGVDGDGKPIFYVRDNGIGILPEHHDRVFGLFNKLDIQTEGTGIGLALVKRIVEVHEGRIWVKSALSPQGEAGGGTTFFFTLPTNPSD
jgi:PAS domain S-box-containing protein